MIKPYKTAGIVSNFSFSLFTVIKFIFVLNFKAHSVFFLNAGKEQLTIQRNCANTYVVQ